MSFAGARVVCFESRREKEMAELVRRRGGQPISAPSMREIPVVDSPEVERFAAALEAREIDVLVLLTGVGAKQLFDAVSPRLSREGLVEHLSGIDLVVRGPKPAGVLRAMGLRATVSVPEPNTWRDLVRTVRENLEIRGRRVAVQEYGVSNPELIAGLEALGADILRVPIYRWALPEDLAPLRAAIDTIASVGVDFALFTSATQVEHLFEVAGEAAGAVREGLSAACVGSIGPLCSEALRRCGVRVDFEPEHPKMGRLVGEAADRHDRDDGDDRA